jgi:stearoyl-CoA desaturase (delta-9 desaturase)
MTIDITAPKTSFSNVISAVVFAAVHLMCLFIFVTGVSWVAVSVCMALYFIRMFAITGGYHRYFSHRSYKTGRVFQFVMGFVGASAAQKGPLWWAAHHRHHHRHSDKPEDLHSPIVSGLWWSHVGWVLSPKHLETDTDAVKDLAKFRELRWLNEHHHIAPVSLAVATFFLGVALNALFPSLGTTGFQMLVWGFFVSTVLTYHATFCINSLTHLIGSRRFKTTDDSRNSLTLALITMGEGWHNNHHRYPGSERQGFYWWEIDLTHYGLTALSWCGLVWDLRGPPAAVYEEAKKGKRPSDSDGDSDQRHAAA